LPTYGFFVGRVRFSGKQGEDERMKSMRNNEKFFSKRFFRFSWSTGIVCAWILVIAAPLLRAEYKSLKVVVQPAKEYSCFQIQGSVTIAVDPYLDNEKIRTAFDVKDMVKKGVYPFHIIISNESDDLISIDGPSILLNAPDHQDRESLTPEDVVGVLLSRSPSRTGKGPSYPSPIPIPIKKGDDSFELHADLTRKELRKLRIEPHTTGAGFLYFQMPPGTKELKGWRVFIPKVRNLKTQKDFLFFEIELK
jgi:hypothetical protein